jgi:hypothetical protein
MKDVGGPRKSSETGEQETAVGQFDLERFFALLVYFLPLHCSNFAPGKIGAMGI